MMMTPAKRTEPWIDLHVPCEPCDGTGRVATAPPGSRHSALSDGANCPSCKGEGYVTEARTLGELREVLIEER